MNTRINEWCKLKFVDPAMVLPQLRIIQQKVADSTLDDKTKNLRTSKLRQHREGWEAAIFCYGMSKVLSLRVCVALYEASDYDAVAFWVEDDTEHFTPIQIKEVVPTDLNPETNIDKEISKLSRYPDSNDTAVVIHVNRPVQLKLQSIKVPRLNIGSLWLMGASAKDQSKWFVAGDLLSKPRIIEFDYPTV